MKKSQVTFSKDFVNKVIEYTEGFFDSARFDKLLHGFEAELQKYYFNKTTESNLLRIFTSLFDRISFFNDCIQYPHHTEIVCAIASSSNYLTDIIVRNPEYLYQLFDQNYLNKPIEEQRLINEISGSINNYTSFQSKLNFYRQLKKRYILKIGIADILGIKNLEETINQLSILAVGINKSLFELCFEETSKKYNLNSVEEKYCLVSLGKLGGGEINYSSDVDLMLFYDEDCQITTKPQKNYSEILSEAALLFIKSSTAISDRGYIYRVDFRLRPDGKNSPICQSISDYLRYYETRGEDWERQMLIKMNFVGGSKALFDKFKRYITSFVYPSSFLISPKEQIKRIKINIERSIEGKKDVKLFSGGIRDIEFSVQVLQLLNGGRNPSIQSGNTLNAIRFLTQYNFLDEKEANQFIESYILYRKIEHFLQLMNDTQTHTIPQKGEILFKLVNYLGLSSTKEFNSLIDKSRTKIKKIYDGILSEKSPVNRNQPLHGWKEVDWVNINFSNAKSSLRNLRFLQSGTGLLEKKEFDSRTIDLFNKISNTLYKYLVKSVNPDKTLDNFSKIIRSSTFPSVWYTELTNSGLFKKILRICEYSQKGVDLLFLDRKLGDTVLTHLVFVKNIEEYFETLSINQIQFILAVQYTLGLIKHQKLSRVLTKFLLFRLSNKCKSINFEGEYFIAALGSFGTEEMTFNSDLDLIVVCKDSKQLPEANNIFQKFLADIKSEMSPFQVDFRLRPEGKSSNIVWDIENYSDYLNKRARVWEFQALSKIRLVFGNTPLYKRFLDTIQHRISCITTEEIIDSITDMHEKVGREFNSSVTVSFNVKKEKGSLLTIDFILTFMQLTSPKDFIKNCGLTTSRKILLFKNSFSVPEESKILLNNYNFLKNVEVTIQNLFNTGSQNIPSDAQRKKELARFLKFANEKDFERALSESAKTTLKIFRNTVTKK